MEEKSLRLFLPSFNLHNLDILHVYCCLKIKPEMIV